MSHSIYRRRDPLALYWWATRHIVPLFIHSGGGEPFYIQGEGALVSIWREREREHRSDPLPLHIAPSLYIVGGGSPSIYKGREPLYLYGEREREREWE